MKSTPLVRYKGICKSKLGALPACFSSRRLALLANQDGYAAIAPPFADGDRLPVNE
ncbi:MAG: hypothetical protein KME45_10800 [Stenomitos rutilans HA7619-LM2]|nr:hypothetical protein [Stenomitos rutilans HA7619-LM2]